jgi:hypothetical protein
MECNVMPMGNKMNTKTEVIRNYMDEMLAEVGKMRRNRFEENWL